MSLNDAGGDGSRRGAEGADEMSVYDLRVSCALAETQGGQLHPRVFKSSSSTELREAGVQLGTETRATQTDFMTGKGR